MAHPSAVRAMSRSVGELRYAIRGVRKFLVFSEDVLRHFDQHRQRRRSFPPQRFIARFCRLFRRLS